MRGIKGVFWHLWTSYASFYFGRVNLSLVIPILLVTYKHLSLYNVGTVSTGFMLAYAVGQFVHGQISERFNPLAYIAVGLLGASALNLVLGFSAGFFWVLMIAEMINGGFESMGWSSTVRANAETSKNPEGSSTILGTAYQAGNSIAWLACSFAIGQWGWQWGFWLASMVMVARGGTLLWLSRGYRAVKPDRTVLKNAKMTFNGTVVLNGVSLCLLNVVRYGVITWIPTYLYRAFKMPIEKVGLSVFLIPVAGILGTLLYNWIRAHKDITTMGYLFLLGLVFVFFPTVSGWGMFLLLLASGLFLYGPHVFLVTTMPSRFLDMRIVASSAGLIDGMGYVGSATVGMLVPFIIDRTGNWATVFYVWAAMAFAVAVIVAGVYFKSNRRSIFNG